MDWDLTRSRRKSVWVAPSRSAAARAASARGRRGRARKAGSTSMRREYRSGPSWCTIVNGKKGPSGPSPSSPRSGLRVTWRAKHARRADPVVRLFSFRRAKESGIAQDRKLAAEHRINERIRANEVRVIGADNEQIGIVKIGDALARAQAEGLDLVEVAPTADPPVCRIMD